jgi:hypothetical protein
MVPDPAHPSDGSPAEAGAGVPAAAAGTDGRVALMGRVREWWPWVLLMLLPVAIYARAWSYPLLDIDDSSLYAASLLHQGGWRGLYDVWSGVWFDDYAPITLWTLWIDLACGDGGMAWHCARIQSPLWLGFGAMAVYACAGRVVERRLAWAAALLYVAHPLCANATLWLAERKNLVAFALTWWCLERYVAWRQGGGAWARTAAWVLGACALLAKPHAVAIPVMMAAWEVCLGPDGGGLLAAWRAAPGWGTVARRLWAPLPAAGAAALFVGIELTHRADFAPEFLGGGRLAAVWCDGGILASYLFAVVCPQRLALYYAVIDDPAQVGALAWRWAAVIAVVAATIAVARRRAVVACGWLMALAAMLPALNLVKQAAPMTDHYVQWGLPGILLALLVAGRDGCARLRLAVTARVGDVALALGAAALALMSLERVPEFASRNAFFTTAYSRHPDHPMNAAGYVYALVDQQGTYHRDSGRLALAALGNPHGHILQAFLARTLIEAGVERWREDEEQGGPGRAGAWAIVDQWGGKDEEQDYIWVRVLMGAGGPAGLAEADQMLSRRLGRDFMTQATAIAARCRDGKPMPDALPAMTTIYLRDSDDPMMARKYRYDFLRLALTLVEVRLQLGASISDPAAQRANDDSALGLALLCVNIDPDFADARRMAAVMYGFIGRDDLAHRMLNPGP